MVYKITNIFFFLLFVCLNIFSQDLLDELETLDSAETHDYISATFKSTRIINSQSIEMPAKKEMLFIIAHRFGSFENKLYDIFGLDQATIRMGLEYTLPTDFICLSVGRSTYQKTYDAGIKIKMLRQQKGSKNIPISMSFYSAMAVSSLRWQNPDRVNYFTSRMSYAHQLMIARKFSDNFSLQLTPTILHKNLVKTKNEHNTFFSGGIGGRYKLNKRVAFTFEYFYFLTPLENIPTVNGQTPVNTFSLGFDIETGGHVFSLHFTNAKAMYDPGIISETTEKWNDLGVHFGFNVNRTFSFTGGH